MHYSVGLKIQISLYLSPIMLGPLNIKYRLIAVAVALRASSCHFYYVGRASVRWPQN